MNIQNDHRVIGKELDLFHIQEEAAGSVFWHENGWWMYSTIKDYMRDVQRRYGYKEVNTPQMVNRSLWEKSGHWENYRHNMFCVSVDGEESQYALKPMNCACHIQIFNSKTVSYRDLPWRMAEFGACMRNESSGSLLGIMRVRSFTQDDAHIFCEEDQIKSETKRFVEMLSEVYSKFGFNSYKVLFSTRPENSAGTDEQWEKAESSLAEACKEIGIEYEINEADGAFYGPKLEFTLTDNMGRDWQCGTIQVDFVLPERLDASYSSIDGEKRPVILHRAILGSFERFIGMLLEHYGYDIPKWINPRYVAIIDIRKNKDEDTFINSMKDRYPTLVIDETGKDIRSSVKLMKEKHFKEIIVYGNRDIYSDSVMTNNSEGTIKVTKESFLR